MTKTNPITKQLEEKQIIIKYYGDIIAKYIQDQKLDLLNTIESELPEKVECEEVCAEMPLNPGLAADQARNYTIDQVKTKLQLLKDKIKEI